MAPAWRLLDKGAIIIACSMTFLTTRQHSKTACFVAGHLKGLPLWRGLEHGWRSTCWFWSLYGHLVQRQAQDIMHQRLVCPRVLQHLQRAGMMSVFDAYTASMLFQQSGSQDSSTYQITGTLEGLLKVHDCG